MKGRDMYIKEITAARTVIVKYDGDNRSSVYVRESADNRSEQQKQP